MSAYDPEMSILLASLCEETYEQYAKGPPPGNDGKVNVPAGYTQIASFTAPEIDITAMPDELQGVGWKDLKNSDEVSALLPHKVEVYFGFALTSSSHNIIALRGTKSAFEWAVDMAIPQVPVPLVWYHDGTFEIAKVHAGFLAIFAMLADQILTAADQFDPSLPTYVTGHSLGAALSVLTAPAVRMCTNNQDVRVYTYAGPRVGDPAFVGAYNPLVPDTSRIVNLADLVPIIPPTQIHWTYEHVGASDAEWSFLNQSGNVAGNHALIGPNNYTAAVNRKLPTNVKRTYPVTGLG